MIYFVLIQPHTPYIYILEDYYFLRRMPYSESRNFNIKMIKRYGTHKNKSHLYKHLSQGQILVSRLLKSNVKEQKDLFSRIKQTGIYTDERRQTFARFNLRTFENQSASNIYYIPKSSTKQHPFCFKTVQSDNHSKKEVFYRKGTMNINQLWSIKNLQELMGSLPYPNDRLKVINFYKKNVAASLAETNTNIIQIKNIAS